MFRTTMGKLQQQLSKGEYGIFKYAPVFESDFIQITRKGEIIDVHNQIRIMTIGIASTSPNLPLPDVMLLAHPAPSYEENAGHSRVTKGKSHKAAKTLELRRLLPLKFVQISIHNHKKQQLHLKFITGRSCYLQLCPSLDTRENLFACWGKLIDLLQAPPDSNSHTSTTLARDKIRMRLLEKDRRRLAVADFQGKEDQDQVSNRNLPMDSEVAGATSAAFAGGKGIRYDSHRCTAMPDVTTPNTKSIELDKVPTSEAAAGLAAGTTAGTSSVETTKAAAPGQLTTATAGAATKDPGESKPGIAMVGATNMSPNSTKTALTSVANNSECASNTSLSPEASMIVATAKAEPTNKAVGEIANDQATGPLLSALPWEGCVSEQSGQQVSWARVEACKSRRDERKRKGRETALRSSHHRRAAESHHKPAGDKILQNPPGWSLARQRDDKMETGCSSPGDSRPVIVYEGISHVSVTKDSGVFQKSGKNLTTSSLGLTTKRFSRFSSFLKNIRANLTTETLASPRGEDVDNLTKTMERNNMEAITEAGESGQWLEMVHSPTLERMEAVTFEPW